MAGSHYETLGVDDGADPDEVRRAYLDLARRLHPDRWTDGSPAEREDVERRMQEVNEAWRVLGNAARRLAYDAGRRRSRPVTTAPDGAFVTGSLFGDDEAPVAPVAHVLRALPWVLVLFALAAIFVVTAYATDGGDDPRSCVRIDGRDAIGVPCDSDGARGIVLRVPDVAQCPAGTQPFLPADAELALCLDG